MIPELVSEHAAVSTQNICFPESASAIELFMGDVRISVYHTAGYRSFSTNDPCGQELLMMGDITAVDEIYIVCGYTDMYKSIDGLCYVLLYKTSFIWIRNGMRKNMDDLLSWSPNLPEVQ